MNIHFDQELFLPVYRPLLDNKDRTILLWGGRDSGKSHFAAQKLIVDCLRLKYFRCILIKKTYESIKDAQYQTIKDIVHDWGLESFFTFRESPLTITCINGNKFLARGMDKAEKIKSIKDPSHAWYEEGNQLSYEDYITATTSMRSSKAEYLQEIFSFNPECEGDYEDFWVYKQWFVGKQNLSFRDTYTVAIDGKTHGFSYTSLHTTYETNKYASPERIAMLMQIMEKDPYYGDVFVRGIWGLKKSQNPFLLEYDSKKHESDSVVYDEKKPILISLDFNLQPFCATIWQYYIDSDGEHFHAVDELSVADGSIPKMIDVIQQRYGHTLGSCFITGDAMGNKGDLSQRDNATYYEQIRRGLRLSTNQIKVPRANPTHANSRAQCNFILRNHPDIKIGKACPNLRRDAKQVECDATGSILKRNRKIITQQADMLDTLRYAFDTFLNDWYMRKLKTLNLNKR